VTTIAEARAKLSGPVGDDVVLKLRREGAYDHAARLARRGAPLITCASWQSIVRPQLARVGVLLPSAVGSRCAAQAEVPRIAGRRLGQGGLEEGADVDRAGLVHPVRDEERRGELRLTDANRRPRSCCSTA